MVKKAYCVPHQRSGTRSPDLSSVQSTDKITPFQEATHFANTMFLNVKHGHHGLHRIIKGSVKRKKRGDKTIHNGLVWRLPTWFDRGDQNAAELSSCRAGAHSATLQQSLERPALPRLVLAGQAGAAASGVHSTRLSLAEGARHAAAAAGLPHPLHAVFR